MEPLSLKPQLDKNFCAIHNQVYKQVYKEEKYFRMAQRNKQTTKDKPNVLVVQFYIVYICTDHIDIAHL